MRGPALMLNPIQHYAWGSMSAIAALQGREPSGQPEAELWMGAHPAAPSHVHVGEEQLSLLEIIEHSPEEMLGPAVTIRFGARLPYLLKVLAADQPLSLQAHPSEAQAVEGFHAEEAQGVSIDAPERNYRDASAKPELLCALSPVDALCGFRDPVVTIELLERLGVGRLQPLLDTLSHQPPEAAMPAVMERLLTWPLHDRAALVADVSLAAKRVSADKGAFSAEATWVLRLAELHPEDPGVVAALLLNLLRLEPGEAVYLPSGNLHAYLGGFGVEVMANSDNVLRGGLTPKHVDVPELQRVLNHTAGPTAVVQQQRRSDEEVVYRTLAPNFELSRLDIGDARALRLSSRGPEILLCARGHASLRHPAHTVSLTPGRSAFVPAAAADVELEGSAVVFRAAVPPEALTD